MLKNLSEYAARLIFRDKNISAAPNHLTIHVVPMREGDCAVGRTGNILFSPGPVVATPGALEVNQGIGRFHFGVSRSPLFRLLGRCGS